MAKKSRNFPMDPDGDSRDASMSDDEFEALMNRAERPGQAAPERKPEADIASIEPGARITGIVVEARSGEVLVELDSKTHGVISQEEFGLEPLPPVGSEIKANYVRFDRRQDLAILTIKEAREEIFWDDMQVGLILEGPVSGTNKGGLTLDIKKIRAFMPISQIERERVEDPEVYVGRRLQCEVTSFDRATQNLVVSRRVILEREAEEKRSQAIGRLTEGDVVDGTVIRILEFGAFIDLGGVDGLLHKSKITEHHKELEGEDALHVGQRITVEITRIDVDRGRIGLDFHQRPSSARTGAVHGYELGNEVTGWVKQLSNEGAVLAFDEGVEGFIPRGSLPDDIRQGSVIRATVTEVDAEAGRLKLKPC